MLNSWHESCGTTADDCPVQPIWNTCGPHGNCTLVKVLCWACIVQNNNILTLGHSGLGLCKRSWDNLSCYWCYINKMNKQLTMKKLDCVFGMIHSCQCARTCSYRQVSLPTVLTSSPSPPPTSWTPPLYRCSFVCLFPLSSSFEDCNHKRFHNVFLIWCFLELTLFNVLPLIIKTLMKVVL